MKYLQIVLSVLCCFTAWTCAEDGRDESLSSAASHQNYAGQSLGGFQGGFDRYNGGLSSYGGGFGGNNGYYNNAYNNGLSSNYGSRYSPLLSVGAYGSGLDNYGPAAGYGTQQLHGGQQYGGQQYGAGYVPSAGAYDGAYGGYGAYNGYNRYNGLGGSYGSSNAYYPSTAGATAYASTYSSNPYNTYGANSVYRGY